MADKKIWVRSPNGEYALLSGPEERDRFVPLGWAETTEEPGPDAWVWMRFDGVEKPAKFPIGSVPHWTLVGWYPGAPPEHVDPTQEPEPTGPLSLAALSAVTPAKPAAAAKNPKE